MNETEIQKRLHKQQIWIDCPECKGAGYITIYKYPTMIDNFVESATGECQNCQGTGKIRKPQPQRNFKKTMI
jgi:DnaJ-class molecular chaperone